MKENTIIQAQNGFYILEPVYGKSLNDLVDFTLVPIIAWHLDNGFIYPMTIEQTYSEGDDFYLLNPNGTVTNPNVSSWDSLYDFKNEVINHETN